MKYWCSSTVATAAHLAIWLPGMVLTSTRQRPIDFWLRSLSFVSSRSSFDYIASWPLTKVFRPSCQQQKASFIDEKSHGGYLENFFFPMLLLKKPMTHWRSFEWHLLVTSCTNKNKGQGKGPWPLRSWTSIPWLSDKLFLKQPRKAKSKSHHQINIS